MLCPTITSASSACIRPMSTVSSARSLAVEVNTDDLVRFATGCSAFSFATTWSQPGGMDTPSRRRTTEK